MKQQILSVIAASTFLAASAVALAQQPAASGVGPAATITPAQPGRYTGPSSMPVIAVKQLLASGKDDQYARLQGKIVSHDHGENYTFADDSGSMSVEISSERFPAGQTITAEQRVELSGKLDKDWHKTEFEVKAIRLLP